MTRPPRARLALATALPALLVSGCIGTQNASEMVDAGPPSRLEYAVGAGQPIELDIPAGEVSIRGDAFAGVAGTVSIRCPSDSGRCLRWASDARLEAQQVGDRVRVALNKKLKMNAQVKVTMIVPQDSPLEMTMGYGELHIADVADDVRVQLKAGELRIEMPADAVAEAHLRARFGDASMTLGPRATEGRRPTLVGARVDWDEGRGAHVVDARLRYGDVQLDLYD